VRENSQVKWKMEIWTPGLPLKFWHFLPACGFYRKSIFELLSWSGGVSPDSALVAEPSGFCTPARQCGSHIQGPPNPHLTNSHRFRSVGSSKSCLITANTSTYLLYARHCSNQVSNCHWSLPGTCHVAVPVTSPLCTDASHSPRKSERLWMSTLCISGNWGLEELKKCAQALQLVSGTFCF
jgi:hypothetical protein